MLYVTAIVQFVIGLVVGTFVFSQMLLPILYSLPKSIIGVIKGRLKTTILLTHIASPIIWLFGIFVAYFISGLILPGVYNLITNVSFISGSFYGLFWLFWGLFSKKGRDDMRSDYDEFIKRYMK